MSAFLNRRQFNVGMALSPLAAGGLLAGCSRIPDVIKIGVAQPLTSPIGAPAKDLLNGVQMAVDELNQSGYAINDKRVQFEIVVGDDRSDAETGKAVAQQLIDTGCVAVIGHLNSGISIATAPIYAAAGLAQLAISTNPKLTQLDLPNTFRLVANDALQARAMGSFASGQFGDKARYCCVDDGSQYGKGLIDGAAAQLKADKREVVIRQSYDDKTVAFQDLANKIKSEKVTAIVTALNDFQVLALVELLKKIDYTSVRVLGGDLVKTSDMAKATGLQGFYTTSPVLEAKEFVAGRQFLEKYKNIFKIAPAYGGHYTYDSMYVLASAIQAAKSVKPSDIVAALHKINGYAPVTGSMKWDAKGEQRYAAVGVYELRQGNWELRMRSDRW